MKILMVCLGNICRSPLAEGIMKHLVKENGLGWHVDSAGTGRWHLGESPDRRAIRVAREHGVDISAQVCRLFRVSDFDEFDVIFAMDTGNLRDIISLCRNDKDIKKVRLLLCDKIVPDPHNDDSQFEPVFALIKQGCEEIIRKKNQLALIEFLQPSTKAVNVKKGY